MKVFHKMYFLPLCTAIYLKKIPAFRKTVPN